MKVFYDNQTFCLQKFGGISRYFYEVIKNASNDCESVVAKAHCENVYMADLGALLPPLLGDFNFKGKKRLIKMQNMRQNIKGLTDKSIDIVHPTYYDPYFLPYIHGKRLVMTAHDMIHELFPQYVKKDDITIEQKRVTLPAADRIIAVSENTKKDLLRLYPVLKASNIDVVYHGFSIKTVQPASSRADYILFTGNRGKYKNFEAFTQAAAPLLKKHGLRLICTGKPFEWQEAGLMEFLGIADRVECRFASEGELEDLYANALLFCFPSMYEGFGIPMLEAFAAGCPLVCSNTSSFPEVAGDAAVYFNPYSIEDMREKIESVILSRSLQDMLISKGQKRLSLFSWEKCAAETEAAYKKVLS